MTQDLKTVDIGEQTFTAVTQTNKLIRELRPLERENRKLGRRQRILVQLADLIAAQNGEPSVGDPDDDARTAIPTDPDELAAEITRVAGLVDVESRDLDEVLDLADDTRADSVQVLTKIIGLSFRDPDGRAPSVEFLDEHMDWRHFDEVRDALGWTSDDDEGPAADPPETPTTPSTGD